MTIDFSIVTEAVAAAWRWLSSEAGILRHPAVVADLEVIPTPDGADIVTMPFERPGPRTRCAAIY